jgi:ectoine hydroxylase-related dioxygenase (phytanoyl-CoA dioxygenase family)
VIAAIEQAMERLGVTQTSLSSAQKEALDCEGYVVLRGVLDADTCAAVIDVFERRYVPGHQSQPPRGPGARHAMLEDEPLACRACLAPPLLASAYHVLRRRFFLGGVQGRDPRPGGGYQRMHRDWTEMEGPSPTVIALAFLDPFSPANGATRVLPGTHKLAGGANAFKHLSPDCPDQVIVEGEAGDVLVMDGYLAHSGTRNATSQPRRNLQIAYDAEELQARKPKPRDLAMYRPEERYLLAVET